jgi:hypothetical protein
MRVLLSFENFARFGGTETYVLTVAAELDRLGHEAAIYSPNHGAMAELAREQGIPVLSRRALPGSCDLVIACDAATCHELAGRYPGAPTVFAVHSADHMVQAPPQLSDRCHGVVVFNDRVRRAVQARAWHARVVRLRQPIDLLRYCYLGPNQPTARTALVSSNYVGGPRAKLIEDACRASGLSVTWIGATTQTTATPEFAIAGADLVIGLGRSVLEGMAAGRAAYVYGIVGGDGWITPESYPAMEADGFAGTSRRERVIDAETMARDLGTWTEQMGEVNRDLASAHHSARDHAIALVELSRQLDNAPPPELSLGDELAHLVRLQFRSETQSATSMVEAARLRSLVAELEREADTLKARAAEAEAALERLKRTRRYRLACRIAAPLDSLRDAG